MVAMNYMIVIHHAFYGLHKSSTAEQGTWHRSWLLETTYHMSWLLLVICPGCYGLHMSYVRLLWTTYVSLNGCYEHNGQYESLWIICCGCYGLHMSNVKVAMDHKCWSKWLLWTHTPDVMVAKDYT